VATAKKKHRRVERHPLVISGLFILLLIPCYILSRLALWIVSPDLFPWDGFGSFLLILFGGCRFDLAAILMVNLPFLVLLNLPLKIRNQAAWRWLTGIVFVLSNFIAILVNLGDSVYYRFTQKRMTGDFINYLKAGGHDLVNLLPQYIRDFWFVPLFLLLLVVFLVIIFVRFRTSRLEGKGLFFYGKHLLSFVVVMAFAVICIRGGFQLKPISLVTAGQYAPPSHVPLVLNTPFTMIKTWNQSEVKEVSYFSNERKMLGIFNPVRQPGIREWRPRNIVIIILESFSAEFSAFLNPEMESTAYRGYMPFLDSLMAKSLTFRGYANGKRSIEAIPAILAGIPSWMNNDYITSSFAGNKIHTLANLLNGKSYHTSFFHGGNNGTMNFDAFARMASFGEYYGRNEYGNDADFDGKWGIFDEPFFDFFAGKLNSFPQPFLSVIFSLSSHHPYPIPPKYKGKFPGGTRPIHQSVGYTDHALRMFFQKASAMPWYHHTLFVITADHTPEPGLPLYKTRLGNYLVPILFFDPDTSLQAFPARTVQQIDIMPSVLDYIGFKEPYICFGSSVFDPAAPRFALSYLNNSYFLVKDRHAMVYLPDSVTALYDLKTDPMQKLDLVGKGDPSRDKMLNFLRAVIQQYNHRLRNNRMTIRQNE